MAINGNYVVRETTANLTRNPTLSVASVLTVFVSLAIVGTAVLVRQGAQNMTERFEGGVEFIVFVDADITQAQLDQVRSVLQVRSHDLDAGVRVGIASDGVRHQERLPSRAEHPGQGALGPRAPAGHTLSLGAHAVTPSAAAAL